MTKNQFKFLSHAVGTDQARRNLTFLEFKVLAYNCTITAANAFLIKQIKISCDLPDGSYYLPGSAIKKLMKISTNTDLINLTLQGVEVDGVVLKWGPDADDVNYPDLSKLIGGDYGPCNNVMGFSTDWMTAALKDAPDSVFKMSFKQADHNYSGSLAAPCKISFNSEPDWTTILMPVLVEW